MNMADDQRLTILILSIVFPIIAFVAVILRFEARRIKRLRLEADDWTIVVTLVCRECIGTDADDNPLTGTLCRYWQLALPSRLSWVSRDNDTLCNE